MSGRIPRVLVVEDEFIVALELKTMLEEEGYEVCGVVGSAVDAIAVATRTLPDCVLMDVSLKGDVDGIETARRIRSGLGIRSAFLTGYPANEIMSRARDADPIGCFVKPLQREEVTAALESFFSDSVESIS